MFWGPHKINTLFTGHHWKSLPKTPTVPIVDMHVFTDTFALRNDKMHNIENDHICTKIRHVGKFSSKLQWQTKNKHTCLSLPMSNVHRKLLLCVCEAFDHRSGMIPKEEIN